MTCKDFDYTFMIAIMQSQHYNFGAETHLGGGVVSAFVASTPLKKAHKDSDHTVVIAVIH